MAARHKRGMGSLGSRTEAGRRRQSPIDLSSGERRGKMPLLDAYLHRFHHHTLRSRMPNYTLLDVYPSIHASRVASRSRLPYPCFIACYISTISITICHCPLLHFCPLLSIPIPMSIVILSQFLPIS